MPARPPRGALIRAAILASGVALLAGACIGPLAPAATPIPASSDTKTETRSVDAFTSVTVDGAFNLVLAAGTAVVVEVSGPTNVLPLIKTAVSGTDLAVTVSAPGYTAPKPVTVRVTSPRVTAVSLSGGAVGTVEAMAEAMTVSVSGDSVMKGIGTVKQLTVTSLGNSDAQLGDLTADAVSVSLAGGGKATVHPVKQLTGTVDAGSVLTLTAAPIAQSVTGGGKVVGP